MDFLSKDLTMDNPIEHIITGGDLDNAMKDLDEIMNNLSDDNYPIVPIVFIKNIKGIETVQPHSRKV